jgi:hypothetical protein
MIDIEAWSMFTIGVKGMILRVTGGGTPTLRTRIIMGP